MVAAYALLAMSSYYGLVMYVEHRDRELILINLMGAGLNATLMVVALFVLRLGILGASVTLLAWSAFQLAGKFYVVERKRAGMEGS